MGGGGVGKCQEAKRALRSNKRCVARGRQVSGNLPRGWEGDTYPGEPITRRPTSNMFMFMLMYSCEES